MSDHVETSLSTPSHAKNLSTASDAWTVHIDRIRRLYIEDGHVLDDVMRIMEREHNFYATYDRVEPHLGTPCKCYPSPDSHADLH